MTDQPYWAGRVADLGIGTAHDGPTPTTAVASTIRTDGATVAATLLLDTVNRERPPLSA